MTLEPLFYWLLTQQEPGTHSLHHTLLAWRASRGHCPSSFSTAPVPICSNTTPFSPDSVPHQLPHWPPVCGSLSWMNLITHKPTQCPSSKLHLLWEVLPFTKVSALFQRRWRQLECFLPNRELTTAASFSNQTLSNYSRPWVICGWVHQGLLHHLEGIKCFQKFSTGF